MNFRFHPEALEEFEQAVLYYEKRQAGLGERFAASVESAIDHIVISPDTWSILEFPVRRRLTRVFPYAVLYANFEDHVLIVAIMHCHRKPGFWKDRLEPGT